MKNAVWGNGGRWLGSVYEVVVVAGQCVQQREAVGIVGVKTKNKAIIGQFGAGSSLQAGTRGSVGSLWPLPWKLNEWGAVSK
jgi:hypothetical protein